MKNKSKIRWLVISSIVLLAILVGGSYAWFMQNAAMTTLLSIVKPDTITISDPDGSDMTELDLDYREGTEDKKDPDGTIHIFRPLCIKSTSPIHQLEIVHTTNLKSLSFKIYPATKNDTAFTFDDTAYVSGKYVNVNQNDSSLAKVETLENYANTNEVADIHAYPLYWVFVNCAIRENYKDGWQEVTSYTQKEFDVVTKTEKIFYYTYYYLEISWKEETKETDLFYIMARNISDSE